MIYIYTSYGYLEYVFVKRLFGTGICHITILERQDILLFYNRKQNLYIKQWWAGTIVVKYLRLYLHYVI